MAYVIGIDVGSQSAKAVLLDRDGRIVADASAPCQKTYPASGWAEQDPAGWEAAVTRAVRAVRAAAGVRPQSVRMLALACQVDGLVALGRDLRPLRPAGWLPSALTSTRG